MRPRRSLQTGPLHSLISLLCIGVPALASFLERGTEAAAKDPQAATDALVEAGDGLDPDLTRAEVDKTLPRLVPPGDDPYGWMDPRAWQRFADYLYEAGQIEQPATADDLLTNALLPKAKGTG